MLTINNRSNLLSLTLMYNIALAILKENPFQSEILG